MKWLAWLVLVLALPCAAAGPPHLNLEVTLDPATRKFDAKADLTTTERLDLSLDPLFKVSRLTVNGVDVPVAREVPALPPAAAGAPQHLRMEYSGTLPALPEGQQRNSPNPAALFASAEGSYLSAGAGWYPDPGVPFTYRVKLSLPAGQSALTPGKQVRLQDSAARFVAEYEFAHPAEGIWVMAGPYQVRQESLALDDGKRVTVRTWFHPELADLATDYLQDSIRYIQRFSRQIGDYPFDDFSIVSSPLSHGLGIPSLTYLGRDVLRLPFIRATSLGHEVLHNWWGNGVYPEWSAGNWSEGLTTFMADYAFREDESVQAAREMRLNWLRDLTGIAPGNETSLVDFKSRHHGISSVIGYGKAAMVFLMLRDEIGEPAFERGIRLFWQRHQFKTANWKDLEKVFADAAGRDLSAFFAQWTGRASSPELVLALGRRAGAKGQFAAGAARRRFRPAGAPAHPDGFRGNPRIAGARAGTGNGRRRSRAALPLRRKPRKWSSTPRHGCGAASTPRPCRPSSAKSSSRRVRMCSWPTRVPSGLRLPWSSRADCSTPRRTRSPRPNCWRRRQCPRSSWVTAPASPGCLRHSGWARCRTSCSSKTRRRPIAQRHAQGLGPGLDGARGEWQDFCLRDDRQRCDACLLAALDAPLRPAELARVPGRASCRAGSLAGDGAELVDQVISPPSLRARHLVQMPRPVRIEPACA